MAPGPPDPARWRALALICLGVLGSLATWFSATAVLPELTRLWSLDPSQAAWMTNAVQAGFVAGALAASAVNLPDIVPPRRLMTASAALAAVCNALLLLEPGIAAALALRALTGMALAGVYPPALKLLATWFVTGRGLALGAMVGALTLGNAMPHLFRALAGDLDWRAAIWASSLSSLAAALVLGVFVRSGPHAFPQAVFDPRQVLRVLRNRPVLLANIGYFGHMWELFAMYAWLLTFAAAAGPQPFGSPSLLVWAAIASGAAGCVLGGLLSDRIGRCATTVGMLCVSGVSALAIGFAFDGPGWLLALIALVWGVSIIGDSAQFSTAVTELADQSFVGTALALQLGIGFALTIVAIWLVPFAAAALGGWQWAFLVLVPGPVVGAWAMLALRRMPEAARMAGGRR